MKQMDMKVHIWAAVIIALAAFGISLAALSLALVAL